MTWISASFPYLPSEIADRVRGVVTTREGGLSAAPFASFNLATHVGDVNKDVFANRSLLRDKLGLPKEPYWLNQTHTNTVIELPYEYREWIEADASFTGLEKHICAVMTADCLPLLVVNSTGTEVAAIHAGWRGLALGIISKTLDKMCSDNAELHVFLGPAIGPEAFEVGQEVVEHFVKLNPSLSKCFRAIDSSTKYLADIYEIAKIQLHSLGVQFVSGGEHCTFKQNQQFYSYRRDGQTGRMVSLIWFES